ncbi:taurine transport system permease protein [Williamsia limnetica]|uniref:Taurine transport system permease protein n=1 Tax=Williamsia limnetica TaxID=882452 RepID=A0A318S390_WILLI|nr:ABC transporter permease [Williamsia limnetica]PYE18117.1 taurine transport system permease protein [Williamsia limnetica]
MSVIPAIAAPTETVGPNTTKRRRESGRASKLLSRVGLPLLSLVVFIALWQLVVSLKIWNETLIPPPSAVWDSFIETNTTTDGVRGYAGKYLWEHLLISLQRIGYGIAIGIIVGIAFGLLMGTFGKIRALFEPWITFLRTLPPLAYFSLLIIWLGINEEPKITLLAIAAFPPVAVATTSAVLAAPQSLIEAAKALGASKFEVIKDVVIPSALPETFTGIRLAVGVAYSSLVAAELVNGLPGIGGMVRDASNYNNTPVVLVGIIAIGTSGLIIDGLLQLIERKTVPWRGRV